MTTIHNFHRVTRRDPCPVCGADSWCMVSRDGYAALCMREIDSADGTHREMSDGTPYGFHWLSSPPSGASTERYKPDADTTPTADANTLHSVYSALLDALALSPAHRAALAARGLSAAAIDTYGYRTMPPYGQRKRVLAQVKSALNNIIPDHIPGIWRGKLSGVEGIVIPVRDTQGRVIACKIRADDSKDGGKYRWLSSTSDDGPGPGAPCHVPLYPLSDNALARVTEGPLKADIATHLSGLHTLGIASCTSARSAVAVLKALNATTVRVALDADMRSNPHVARGLALAVKVYREAGFTVEIETWDPSSAKGIDDALSAGVALSVHAGDAVDRVVSEACEGSAKGKAKPTTPTTERVAPMRASAGEAAPSHGVLSDSNPKCFDRGDAVEIAHALIDELTAESVKSTEGADHADSVVYDRGSFYVYDTAHGIYTERTQSELFQRVSRYAGSIVGPKDKALSLSDRDIRGAIHAASQLVYRRDFFDSAPRGVVFANGFVTVRDGAVTILPHSPAHRAAHAIACEYTGAPTDDDIDLWLRTMREVFRRPIEDEKGNLTGIDEYDTDRCMDLFQEFAGAALMGYATSYAACLVLQGDGNDGKSTLLHVLRALFPASSISSIPPQSWSRGFLLAGLAGKRLNVVSELPSQDLMDSERFKAVVSGDTLTAERKHQDPFTTAFEAGHVFAANTLMSTRDQTRGFWRRFVVIPCMRQFADDEVVRDHHKTIIARELSGIAAWAIEGAARLARQGAYTNPESVKKAKDDWQKESDQMRQWVEDCCVPLPRDAPARDESTIETLYACYRAWSVTTGHPALARNKVAQRLKGLGYAHHTKMARLYRLRLNERWEKIMAERSEREQNGEKGLTYGRKPVYPSN